VRRPLSELDARYPLPSAPEFAANVARVQLRPLDRGSTAPTLASPHPPKSVQRLGPARAEMTHSSGKTTFAASAGRVLSVGGSSMQRLCVLLVTASRCEVSDRPGSPEHSPAIRTRPLIFGVARAASALQLFG